MIRYIIPCISRYTINFRDIPERDKPQKWIHPDHNIASWQPRLSGLMKMPSWSANRPGKQHEDHPQVAKCDLLEVS